MSFCFSVFMAAVFFLIQIVGVFGQATESTQLTASIVELQAQLKKTLPAKERANTLRTLARLEQLAGNFEAASSAWQAAAGLNPGDPTNPLLEAARCNIAMGELDVAKTLIGRVKAARSITQADRNNAAYLSSLIVLFEQGKNPLESNFSAFARVNGGKVDPPPANYWLLCAGLVAGGSESLAMVSASEPEGKEEKNKQTGLQTGLFANPDNAEAQAARLGAKGFEAIVTGRVVGGAQRYAVIDPSGDNENATIMKLKDAGFEAYPLN